MVDARLPRESTFHAKEDPASSHQVDVTDDDVDEGLDGTESNHCSFSLLDLDEEPDLLNDGTEGGLGGSRTGADFTNMSSSLTDAIVSSPSTSSHSVEDYHDSRSSENRVNSVRATRAKHDRRTAKQLTERKRRDRINALLDTLRNLILRLLRKNPRHHRKLEKADILELVVSFLKRELQKSRQPKEHNCAESKSVPSQDPKAIPFHLGSELKSCPTAAAATSPFATESFNTSPGNPLAYTAASFEPYLPNFPVPLSQIPQTPCMLIPDPVQNPASYHAACPSGLYPLKTFQDPTNYQIPEAPASFNMMMMMPLANRKPLGSIENVSRATSQTNFGLVRSPLKELKQVENIPTSMCPVESARLCHNGYKMCSLADENNQGSYSHLQNVLLNSTASAQNLWRPYV